MAKKKRSGRKPPIAKVDPGAISIRSAATGRATVLFDESFRDELTSVKFDPLDVAFRQSPKAKFEKLCGWAGEGRWMAIASHPEILDSDGVPGLDIVIAADVRQEPPEQGFWFDPLIRYLDLPSGTMRVVYDEQCLRAELEADEACECRINSSADEDLRNDEYSQSGSYLVGCPPGFYRAVIFTRLYDVEYPDRGAAPDLAIFLTRCRKPKRTNSKQTLVPIHPPDRDVNALRRRASGLPPLSSSTKHQKPTLLKDGSFRGKLTNNEMLGFVLDMPQKLQQPFGFEAGQLVSIEMVEPRRQSFQGLLTHSSVIDPTVWELVERLKRKAANFAMVQSCGDSVKIEMIKESRKTPLDLPDGETTVATMKLLPPDPATGQPSKVPNKQSAVGHPKAVQIPKRVGQPGPCVEALVPMIEVCEEWTQACLFEVNGQTLIGAIQVFPPQRLYDDVTLPAKIHASIGIVQGGLTAEETPKQFRGFPDGIARAFKWVARHVKGGWLWTNRFELDVQKQRGKKLDRKAAKQAAIQAWQEVLGIGQ